MRKVLRITIATSVLLLALAVGYSLIARMPLHTPPVAEDTPELVLDRAGLFDKSGYARIIDYHDALRDGYDIDYRVVTTVDAPDLNRFAVETFSEQRVGSLSGSGKGLLLVIDPKTDKVRLEVGRNLEGVYVDAFVKYIENEQMVPFFRRKRVADGILATTEMIVTRAQEAEDAFDPAGKAEPSTGAGAITEAHIGVAPEKKPVELPNVTAGGSSPVQVVQAYIRAMEEGNDRPDLDIYSKDAQEMLKNWVVTKAQMRNVVRDHRKCRGERSRIDGDKAVVRYDMEPKVCSPYFLRREEGEWRIDFASMQKLIRFDQHNYWHMWVPNEFSFAFPEMKPTRVKTGCRWCFMFRNEDMVIVSVDEGSVSDKMGLEEGDKIMEIDGRKSPGMRWVFDYMASVEAGKMVAVTVLREGEKRTFSYPAPPR